ncbi:MAG: zinc ribbon domain-containing protein [Lachnospiraceae bacterium]|nr:zinc ribbon domain-containing protein [Lachnospiraceae bacterium]
MAFCTNCGKPLAENACFCSACGKATGIPAVRAGQVTVQKNTAPVFGLRKYTGVSRRLPFVGNLSIEVSAPKDAMNEYVRQFHGYVNSLMRNFQRDYRQYCSTFDGYIDVFVDVNGTYVRAAAQEAVGLLLSYGYYHYTEQDLLNYFQDTPAFKALDEFHESNLELANAYLEDNYNQAVNKINNMPNQTFFGMGLGGMALSYGLSAMTGAMQNKRANKMIENSRKLTPAQEREFFSIVREADVMFFVWDELNNVGNTAISLLADMESGSVDWPFQPEIDEAMRIFENMKNPRFPQDQLAVTAKRVLEEFPYIGDLYPFLKQRFGDTPQIRQIEQYFFDPQLYRFFRIFPEYQ